MKKLTILLAVLITLCFVTNGMARDGRGGPKGRVWRDKTAAPAVTDDLNQGYRIGDIWVDTTNDNSYILQDKTGAAAVWSQVDSGGRDEATTTAVDIDVIDDGEYHATAQTIFIVDLSSTSYAGKTFTFSTEVSGMTVWFKNAISVKDFGSASGVTIQNNTDPAFMISIYFPTGTSGFPVAQNGSASYTIP